MSAPNLIMPMFPEERLPVPRLELRWRDLKEPEGRGYKCECLYNLVLALDKYDIRAERYDEDGNSLPKMTTLTVQIGRTLSDGDASERAQYGRVQTPFRDHSHAMWDRKQLGNLPVYAVADGKASLVLSRPEMEGELPE